MNKYRLSPRLLGLLLPAVLWVLGGVNCPSGWTQSPAPVQTEADGVAKMQAKMASLVIPRLELHDTPLDTAIDQVREASRSLDVRSDEADRGIGVFLKLPLGSTTTPRVTLTLVNTSVIDALRSIAAQIGDKVKIGPYAVSIVPLTESTEPMVSAVFALSRQTFGSASETDDRVDAKSWLEAKGISFPPGASAVYLPRAQKLIVRNTQDNLDRIKPLVANPSTAVSPATP